MGAEKILDDLHAAEGPWCTLKFGLLQAGTVRNAMLRMHILKDAARFSASRPSRMGRDRLNALGEQIAKDLGVKSMWMP